MRPLFLAGFFLLAFAAIQRRHYIRGALCGLLGLYISLYLKSCRHWLDGLGSDSFSEAQNFAWKEALFFLETISSILQPLAWNQLLETAGIALLITALIIVALRRADRWVPSVAASHRIVLLLGAVCLAIPMGSLVRHAYARFQSNSAIFESIQRNFTHPDLKLVIRETGEHRMRLLVYIGESTTSLHWSLYGYPRNTTPRLDAFREREPGFLVFRDVISTQVMTSPSLLEALSFQWAPGQAYLPINERQRVSLVDVLRRLSIPTRLFSNQAASGTYSLAGPIIFRHATHVDYSRKHAAVMGDLASKLGALPDDRYFLAHAPWFDSAPGLPAVTFLHSYAGHGDYLGNIPPDARSPVDTRLQGVSPARVFGEALDDNRLMARNAEGYDSAMRYVDRSIHSVLEQVRAFDQPTVFLYFADHGESPYTNVGHDSARFHHEMFRVPFLMYFNDAAQQAAPELFTLFSQASRQARPSTLAQVPATILRLLGYRLEGIPQPYQGIGLDDPASLAPVVVRRLGDTFSYVRGHGTSAAPPPQARDDTDRATRIWLHRRGRIGNTARPTLCYGGTNTWAKAVRGAAVADCLSVPVVLLDGKLAAAPVSDDAVWALDAVARIAAARRLQLRLNGQGIQADALCVAAAQWLQARNATGARHTGISLVLDAPERPMDSSPACERLSGLGIEVVLAVPAEAQQDAARFKAWQHRVAEHRWPNRYQLPSPPSAEILRAMSSMPEAQWHLEKVDAERLPWNPPVTSSENPMPASLTVSTKWDVNSARLDLS